MTDLEAMRTSHATAALDLAERFDSWFRAIGRELEDLRAAVDRDRRDSQIATTDIRRRLTDEVEQAEARETLLRHRLDAIVASRSWRVTGPIRAAGQLLRGSFALARRRT